MTLESMFFPLVGGGALGFAAGYFLKNVAKLAIIAIGAVALFLGFLEFHKWITVNWMMVESQIQAIVNNATSQLNQVTNMMGHEIPISAGIIGFIPGLIGGFLKG